MPPVTFSETIKPRIECVCSAPQMHSIGKLNAVPSQQHAQKAVWISLTVVH
jgi:hypothetical protein